MSATPFILPEGITGFSDTPERTVKSFSKFKLATMEAARRITGRASGFASAGISPNFHQATIKAEDETLIVCNAAFEFIAFAHVSTDARLVFTEHSGLNKSYKLQGYKVLAPAVLTEALSAENCSSLAEAELEQIQYWKVKTIGEAIFNWFD